jgi:hypothetical protein
VRAKRVVLLVTVAVVVIAGGAAGAAVALSGSGARLASASFPGYGIAFRYPAAWKRVGWCWTGTVASPMALLTTARRAPACEQGGLVTPNSPFPPPQQLGSDGVTVAWLYSDRPSSKPPLTNSRVGGRPASVRLGWRTVANGASGARCGKPGTRERRLVAAIPHWLTSTGVMRADAVICGPDYAAGEAAVERMLASVRFTG